MQIFAKFLGHWMGWVSLILVIRILIYFLYPQPQSQQEVAFSLLVDKATQTQNEEIRTMALETISRLLKKEAVHRATLEEILRKKFSSSAAAEAFLGEIQDDPYPILKATVDQLYALNPKDFKDTLRMLSLALALVFLGVVPLLLWYGLGRKSIHKIFGGLTLLLVAHGVLWSLVFFVGTSLPWLVQLVASLGIFWAAAALVQSGTLTLLTGLALEHAKKIPFGLALVLLAGFFPYSLSSSSRAVNEELLLSALMQAEQKEHFDTLPLLVNLCRKSPQLSYRVQNRLIQALGTLGNEKTVPLLFAFLESSEANLQKATLAAIASIYARIDHPHQQKK